MKKIIQNSHLALQYGENRLCATGQAANDIATALSIAILLVSIAYAIRTLDA